MNKWIKYIQGKTLELIAIMGMEFASHWGPFPIFPILYGSIFTEWRYVAIFLFFFLFFFSPIFLSGFFPHIPSNSLLLPTISTSFVRFPFCLSFSRKSACIHESMNEKSFLVNGAHAPNRKAHYANVISNTLADAIYEK